MKMLQHPYQNPIRVVNFENGDQEEEGPEGGNGGRRRRNRERSSSISNPSLVDQQQLPLDSVSVVSDVSSGGSGPISPMGSSNHQYQTFESRSFWKAGDYDVGSIKSAPPEGQLEHARVHPKFLHSNATSHKWAFGAIAELLDNAVDEIRNGATFVKVDKIYPNMRDKSPALLFQDNGGGMDPACLRQCMSLGYSSKKANTTIGQYGNGFKTSTMRLGADVIVFSRAARGSRVTQSIGLLSYTFLKRTGQDDVIVPMVDFEINGNQTHPIIYSSHDDWTSNLKLILEWSPFDSKDELMQQFDAIGVSGTKVIIYNLWLNDDGVLELDFDDDEEDIRLRDEVKSGILSNENKYSILLESHVSYRLRFSLRVYASILYLRKFTNFHIILRGKPVEQYIIAENLSTSEVVTYRPRFGMTSKEVSVETTIGLVKEAPVLAVSGFNVYHKNRLIKPFWKVNLGGSSRGRCTVGVLEANFIEPAHDKQDFERSALFFRLEVWLRQLILKYWERNSPLAKLFSKRPRNTQKEYSDHQPIIREAGSPNKWPTEQQDVGFSVNLEEEVYLYQPLIGLADANMHQGLGNGSPIVGLAANSQNGLGSVQTIIGLAAANMQQGFGGGPPIVGLAANSQKEFGTAEPITGLAAANMQQGFGGGPPIVGLAAICQREMGAVEPIIGLAAANMHQGFCGGPGGPPIVGLAANSQKELGAAEPIIGLTAGSFREGACSEKGLIDQICEENIELFMRCDAHRKKEIELKNTIEGLEEKLEEAKRKWSLLAFHVESQKKQILANHNTGKA